MNKFIPQYEPHIRKSYIKAAKTQMETGWIGTSTKTLDFEDAIAKLTGHKHCISTTSGTMALYLGLASLDIPAGKTILFPSYTFLAGANVIKQLGYNIRFVDIKHETLCMNPDLVELDDTVGAVMFVDHNGYIGEDRERIKAMCVEKNIHFIEDSAQGFGIKGAGNLGIFSIFSFSVPKLVTTGQGGVLLTNIDAIAEKAKQLRDHGDNWRRTKEHDHIGLNLKFNDIAAAIGLAQISILDELLVERKRVFDAYRRYLDIVDFGYESTWMIILPTRNTQKIISRLKNENVQAVQYYRPIPSNKPFNDGNKYPEAEVVYENYLYLPSSLNLKNKDITRICKIIKDVENI